MTNDNLAELNHLVKTFRAIRKDAAESDKDRSDSPGARLAELNRDWSQTLAEHEAKIAPLREAYNLERQRLTALSVAEKQARPKRERGRPKVEFPDAIKIAAYRASLDEGRSVVRVVMGLGTMQRLDEIIAEGKSLFERATDPNW